MQSGIARSKERDARPSSRYFEWRPAGSALSVRLSFAVIDQLESSIRKGLGPEKRGVEVGGVLFGRAESTETDSVVHIDDFELVDSEHRRGPSYVLSESDKRRLERVLRKGRADRQVVGFVRSHTRLGLYLDQEDFALIQSYFPGISQVFLLVRPNAGTSSVAGFFHWEEGTVHRQSTYLEFPFSSAEIRKARGEPISAPSDGNAPPQQTFPARAHPPEDRARLMAQLTAYARTAGASAASGVRSAAARIRQVDWQARLSRAGEQLAAFARVAGTRVRSGVRIIVAHLGRLNWEAWLSRMRTQSAAYARAAYTWLEAGTHAAAARLRHPPPAARPSGAEVARGTHWGRRLGEPAAQPAARAQATASSAAPAHIPHWGRQLSGENAQPADVSANAAPVPRPRRRLPGVSARQAPTHVPHWGRHLPDGPAPAAGGISRPDGQTWFSRATSHAAAWARTARASIEFAARTVAARPFVQRTSWRSAAAMAAVLVCLGVIEYQWLKGRVERPVTAIAAEAPPALHVERRGGYLMVNWNRGAASIVNAERGRLEIIDGDQRKELQLDPAQLRTGSVAYAPINSDVNFRLELAGASGRVSESLRVVEAPEHSAAAPAPLAPPPVPARAAKKAAAPVRRIVAAPPKPPAEKRAQRAPRRHAFYDDGL